ncbi:MAG: hypothetical protein JSR98_02450 [Proteobacteria bacterium]|nr:hypothetical protein [Pseudomonadota bacterium]
MTDGSERASAGRVVAGLTLGPALGGLASAILFLAYRLGSAGEALQAGVFVAAVFGLAPGVCVTLPVYRRRGRTGLLGALATAILPGVLGVGLIYLFGPHAPDVPAFGRQLFFMGLGLLALLGGTISGLVFWLAVRPRR